MAYKLKYNIEFENVLKENCIVEIYEDTTDNLIPVNLLGASDCFEFEIDDDEFMYTPIRFGAGSLTVVGDDYLQNLFSIDIQQHKVIYKVSGDILFQGFLTTEVYSQEYTALEFQYQMEIQSALSSIQYIKMDKDVVGNEISLIEMIEKILLASKGTYSGVYLPNKYTQGYNNLTFYTSNYIDEDGEASNYDVILEGICNFLNVCCVEDGDNIYFFDYDYTGTYQKYIFSGSNLVLNTSTYSLIKNRYITKENYRGDSNQLSIVAGYNKATVVASNYDSDTTETEDFEYGNTKLTRIEDDPRYLIKNLENFLETRNLSMKMYNVTEITGGNYVYSPISPNLNETQGLSDVNNAYSNSYFDKFGSAPTSTSSHYFNQPENSPNLETAIRCNLMRYPGQREFSPNEIHLNDTPIELFKGYADDLGGIYNEDEGVLFLTGKVKLVGTQSSARSIDNSTKSTEYLDRANYYLSIGVENRVDEILDYYDEGESNSDGADFEKWFTGYFGLANSDNYPTDKKPKWLMPYLRVKLKIGNKYLKTTTEIRYRDTIDNTLSPFRYTYFEWTTTESIASIAIGDIENLEWFGWNDLQNTLNYTLGTTESGFYIPIPEGGLEGNVEWTIYNPWFEFKLWDDEGYYDSEIYPLLMKWMWVQDFKVNYGRKSNTMVTDVEDTKYETVVNERFSEELDEVTFTLTSANGSPSYISKVHYNGSVIDKLTLRTGGSIKPEQYYLDKIVSQYSQPKYVLELQLEDTYEIYDIITEPGIGRLIVIGKQYESRLARCTYKLLSLDPYVQVNNVKTRITNIPAQARSKYYKST